MATKRAGQLWSPRTVSQCCRSQFFASDDAHVCSVLICVCTGDVNLAGSFLLSEGLFCNADPPPPTTPAVIDGGAGSSGAGSSATHAGSHHCVVLPVGTRIAVEWLQKGRGRKSWEHGTIIGYDPSFCEYAVVYDDESLGTHVEDLDNFSHDPTAPVWKLL